MLRYYQQDAVNACYRYLESNAGRNPCIVLPTGAGKTHVIVKLCEDVCSWGSRVLVLAHVKELLQQATEKLTTAGLDVGVYSASLNRKDSGNRVVVAGVQSAYKRGLEIAGSDPFGVVIIDEAHRIPTEESGMYVRLLEDLKAANPKLRVVGLTATPYRTGEGYVCSDDHFLNDICYEVGIRELIAGGFLCPLSSKRSPNEVDLSGLKIARGDYVQSDMESRFSDSEKVDTAAREIVDLTADRRKVLIFCCGIGHATDVAARLDELGQSVRVVTSQHGGRDAAIEAFKAGGCKYLVNVSVLTEGFDAPDIDGVVLLRSTVSPGLYYQMVGRGLRIHENKSDCLVLDFGGNVRRLGTIDELNIKETGKADGTGEAPVKACPECNEMVHAGLMFCSGCGFEFPPNEPNHEAISSGDSPLAGDAVTTTWPVTEVAYTRHEKKVADGDTPKPPSMRVTYYDGTQVAGDEWVCIEHTGFAYEKAFNWWAKRSNNPMPKTVDEAIELARGGALAEPTEIKVRPQKKNPRYKEIFDCVLGPRPEVVTVDGENWWTAEIGDLPF